ncbi:hypothetical protein AB3S75_008418 [Citrus x aurantiifolia]
MASQLILGLMARKTSVLKLNFSVTSEQVSPSWAPYTESQVGRDVSRPPACTFPMETMRRRARTKAKLRNTEVLLLAIS